MNNAAVADMMQTSTNITSMTPEFVLVTFDMPATMKKERHQFLKKAKDIGAVEHSQSAYYMPFSPATLALAEGLAQMPGTKVYVHLTAMPDTTQTQEMHLKYAQAIAIRCDIIDQRLDIAQQHVEDGHLDMAQRSFTKTQRLLTQLITIRDNGFNPPWLTPRLTELAAKWKEIYGLNGGKDET